MTPEMSSPQSRRADDGNRPVLVLLIIGTVIALACAFGPVWFARVGIVVAIATAVIVWVYALRTIRQLRRDHLEAMTALTLRAAEEMRVERARERATLDAVNARMDQLTGTITELRGELDGTVRELDEAYATIVVRDTEITRQRDRALQAEKQVDARRAELAEREAELAERRREAEELRLSLQRYEAELAALQQPGEAEDTGEIVGLPRRVDRSAVADEPQVKQA